MEQHRVPKKLPSEINILAQRKGRLKKAAGRTTAASRKNIAIEDDRLVLIYRHRAKRVENQNVIKCLITLSLPFAKCASFRRLTPEVFALLHIVEPFVIWGFPKMTVVHDMIFEYGELRNPDKMSKRKAVQLSSDKVIENMFGKYGIISVEDLVHEIMTLGPNFDMVQSHFRSFCLREPLGAWPGAADDKIQSIRGRAGFLGEEINELFERLL